MSIRPPLPPVARVEAPPPRSHVDPGPHTMPGWIAVLIHVACLIVLGWAILTRMLPGTVH